MRWLAEACARVDAHLVHLSTDYVFDGTLDRPYREWDLTAPAVGVRAVEAGGRDRAAALGTDATVVRTSWVCGEHGSNIVATVLRLAPERDGHAGALAFVDDQRGHPTFTADLAPLLRRLALDRRSGVMHATNQGAVSWYEFVGEVLAAAGHDRDDGPPDHDRRARPASPSAPPGQQRARQCRAARRRRAPAARLPRTARRARRRTSPLTMGFTRAELEAFRDATVPDLVGPGLRLLFVGINPGLWTAATSTHFAHPGNRFYPALLRAGVIDRADRPRRRA